MVNVICETIGIYKGYIFAVSFTSMGHRCGYVASDKYIDTDKINCHGGITYSKAYFPFEYEPKGKINVIGFDCGHICDKRDIEATKKYFGIDVKEFVFEEYATIKDNEFCIRECKNIIDQIVNNKERENEK